MAKYKLTGPAAPIFADGTLRFIILDAETEERIALIPFSDPYNIYKEKGKEAYELAIEAGRIKAQAILDKLNS